MSGELHDFLRDVVPRIGLHRECKLGEFRVGRCRSDHDAVSAGFGDRLHDQFVESAEARREHVGV